MLRIWFDLVHISGVSIQGRGNPFFLNKTRKDFQRRKNISIHNINFKFRPPSPLLTHTSNHRISLTQITVWTQFKIEFVHQARIFDYLYITIFLFLLGVWGDVSSVCCARRTVPRVCGVWQTRVCQHRLSACYCYSQIRSVRYGVISFSNQQYYSRFHNSLPFFCVQYTEKRYRVTINGLRVKCIFCFVPVEFLSSVEVHWKLIGNSCAHSVQ